MKTLAAGLIGILLAMQSLAQNNGVMEDIEVTEEYEAAVNQLLLESGKLEIEVLADVIGQNILLTMQQSGANIPPTAIEIIVEELVSIFGEEIERGTLQSMLVPIHARYYSQDEIEELITFYRSPIGRKLAETTPLLDLEAVQAVGRWLSLLEPVLIPQIMQGLQEAGIDLD